MKKYKCVTQISLPVYGDDGLSIENEYLTVEEGSVWEKDTGTYRFVASQDSVRLLNPEGGWVEIHDENLANHFEQM